MRPFSNCEGFVSADPPQRITWVFISFFSVIFHQAYAQGPYGEYAAPPPHATQIVYSADGQPYAVAYPYHYQGKNFLA